MGHRSGLGFSSAEAISSSDHSWKERLAKIAIFLCLLILLGLLFTYIGRETQRISSQAATSDSSEVGWDLTTQ